MRVLISIIVFLTVASALGEGSLNMTYKCAFNTGYGKMLDPKTIMGESTVAAKINFLNSYDIEDDGFYIKNQKFFAKARRGPVLRSDKYVGVVCDLTDKQIEI